MPKYQYTALDHKGDQKTGSLEANSEAEAMEAIRAHGRKGIYELLDINDTLRDMITDRAPSVVLKQKAIEMGMSTLREDGLRNIYDGNTTIEEVLKYT